MSSEQVQGHKVDISGTIEDYLLEYERPYLYPKQANAIFDSRRYSFIEASTKAGKTSGCIVWIFEQALHGQEGWNYWWVAPVSGQADIAFRRCVRAIPQDLRSENQTLKTITLINGAVIWFKSADKPDSLYGEDVYAAVMDEASRTKEDSWYAVRSTLTATRGPIRIIGNVKGRRNWFYQLARKAERNEDPNAGYHKITALDAVAAHVLDGEEIEDARRQLPEQVFQELYMAEPADDGGNPFGLAAIARCVKPHSPGTKAVVRGIDFAKKQDWTVDIGLDQFGRVAEFDRYQIGWEEQVPRLIKSIRHTPTLADSTGVGDAIVERLQKKCSKVEGYVFSPKSKQILMEALAVAIQNGEIEIPDAAEGALPANHPGHIRRELESFEYVYERTGVKYSAPEGFHDDCVMALALAVYHRSHAKMPMKISSNVKRRLGVSTVAAEKAVPAPLPGAIPVVTPKPAGNLASLKQRLLRMNRGRR